MQKKRILIVDDEESITRVFKLLIEKTGRYDVWTETNGSAAFEAAKRFKPDLILLDIMMPDVDGGEVACQIKEDKDTCDIPIVFVSAAITKEEAIENGHIYGGYPILAKPVPLEDLMQTIEKYCDGDVTPYRNNDSHASGRTKFSPRIERRMHRRITTIKLMPYDCMDKNNTKTGQGMGKIIDISQGGLLLETNQPIDSEYIQITTRGTQEERVIIKGRVIYSEKERSDIFFTGIGFLALDNSARKFVAQLTKFFS